MTKNTNSMNNTIQYYYRMQFVCFCYEYNMFAQKLNFLLHSDRIFNCCLPTFLDVFSCK